MTVSFCHDGAPMVWFCKSSQGDPTMWSFFIAWLAPLAFSHASLTLSCYLCTLPTAIAIAGQLPPTLPAAVMSAPPTILRRLHEGRVPSLPHTTCLAAVVLTNFRQSS